MIKKLIQQIKCYFDSHDHLLIKRSEMIEQDEGGLLAIYSCRSCGSAVDSRGKTPFTVIEDVKMGV